MLSDRQRNFIHSLLDERAISRSKRQAAYVALPTLSTSQASRWIERLLSLPKWQEAIPEGNYAIIDETTSTEHLRDHYAFFKVDTPKEGRWAGLMFVSQYASDERHPVRDKGRRLTILEATWEVTPKVAAEEYGQRIGACAICNRTLTDPTSIALGIGPTCRGKTGWYTDEGEAA